MKNNQLLIFGGVAALAAGYYFVSKKKSARASTAPTRAGVITGGVPKYPDYVTRLDPSGGKMCFHKDGTQVPLVLCKNIGDALEGVGNYVSIGACCKGCAQGIGCAE